MLRQAEAKPRFALPAGPRPAGPERRKDDLRVLDADGGFTQGVVKVANASWDSGTARITTPVPHQSVFVSGVSAAGYNGVFTVTATRSDATVQLASLNPVALSTLPINPITEKPSVSLDTTIAGYFSQFVVMVTPAGEDPYPLGLTAGTINVSNLGIPPFAVGTQTGNAVADIVEFFYAGSEPSTFDVSQVDGFALPLTVTLSMVTKGPGQVGVNPAFAGLSRQAIEVSGAGSSYDGSFTGLATGLVNNALAANQFTFTAASVPTVNATGQVTPTDSGVIDTSDATVLVEIEAGTPPAVGDTVKLAGVEASVFDGLYTVQQIPPAAGLPATAVWLATTAGACFRPVLLPVVARWQHRFLSPRRRRRARAIRPGRFSASGIAPAASPARSRSLSTTPPSRVTRTGTAPS